MRAIGLAPPKTRLRKDGIKVSKNQVNKIVLDLLKNAPRTPSELAPDIGYGREWVSRGILKPLLEAGKVSKIQGTDKYKLADQNYTAETVKSDNISKSQFKNDCSTIKKWCEKSTSENLGPELGMFATLCLGLRTSEFKINPDNWRHPETTRQAIKAIRKQRGQERLPWSLRQMFRHFIDLGLEIQMSKSEAKELGIDGDKDKAHLADLEMTGQQYHLVKKILKKSDYPRYLKFGFRFGTFCRPSTMYIVKTKDLIFYDRKIPYVELNGKKFFKKEIVDFVELGGGSPDAKIKTLTQRGCKLKIHEFKTDTTFPKYIFDEDFIKDLEKYCKQRLFQKKKYLFWHDNSTEFVKKTYVKITHWWTHNDNTTFKKVFFQVGFTKGDFGKTDRANYAIRHFGLQWILQMTDYDFGFVGEMSHDDVATLKKWYGKRSMAHLEKKIAEVVF